eukprot:364199-Chlamydomonas_euryale.AAC.3
MHMGRREVTHANFLHRVVGVKLTACHRVETLREKYGTSSLALMVRKRALQWMGQVLRMDRLPWQLCNRRVPLGQWWHHFSGLSQFGRARLLCQRYKQRRRNLPCTGRPGGTLFKTSLPWNKEALTVDHMIRSSACCGDICRCRATLSCVRPAAGVCLTVSVCGIVPMLAPIMRHGCAGFVAWQGEGEEKGADHEARLVGFCGLAK